MTTPARSVSAEPLVFSVGSAQLSVALPVLVEVAGFLTVMLNAGRVAASCPLLTEISMFP
jgi:hypothetical protein